MQKNHKINLFKNCVVCEQVFFKIKGRSYYDWSRKKCCSKKCWYISQTGEGNPFYGKKHTKITKQILSKKRLGKKGLPHTEATKRKIANTKYNQLNPMWKGVYVGYNALHNWIRRRLKKSQRCEVCKKITNNLDLANISQKYKRDLTDWEWLCRKCHMTKDGRLNNLLTYNYVQHKKNKSLLPQ